MKKILIASLALATSLSLGSALVACSDIDMPDVRGTISVAVNGIGQVSGGTIDAVVGTAYTVTASSSNGVDVSIKYVFDSETTKFTDSSFTPSAAGNYVFTFSAKSADDFTLTFSVEEQQPESGNTKQFKVEFKLGDHAASDAKLPDDRVVLENNPTKLPQGPKPASGYEFAGWSDGKTTYGAGQSYKVTAPVTFIAEWDPVTVTNTDVTVSYELGDHAASGAKAPASDTVKSGNPVTLPLAPAAASGWKFKGWSDGTTTHTAGTPYNATKTITLTGDWELIKYDVTYVLGENAASTAKKPDDVKHVGNLKLPPAPEAAAGYKFKGWYDGTTYTDAGDPYNVTQKVTLTAKFEPLTEENENVTIKFELGNHAAQNAQKPANKPGKIGGTVTLPAAPATEDGYKFAGWSDGTNEPYDESAEYPVKSDCTLTALWDELPPITNGDFEKGNLTGWTVISGDEGTLDVVSVTEYWAGDKDFNDMNGQPVQRYLQDGTYFLLTDKIGKEGKVAVKSQAFTLKGDGIISFKLGVAKNPTCYVALCDASTNAELIKVTNDYFSDPTLAQVLLRRFMYANDYVGRSVYIKIVDNDEGDLGFLGFDALKVNLTVAQAQEIVTADKQAMANYRQDVLDSNASMGGQAKNIVNAVRGYYAALTVTDVHNVYFVQKISDKALSDGQVNLNEYLSETSGSMYGVQASTITKSIVKVNDGTADYTTEFNAFSLAAGKTYTVTYRITEPVSGKTADETFTITVTSNFDIINGDFESDFEGWTVTGNAFGIETNATCWRGDYNQHGNKHVDGWASEGNEAGTGTMRSSNFVLGGTGKISFRLGGGNFADGTYISVKTKAGVEIARFTNTKQADVAENEQYMWVYVFDLTTVAQLGDELYIEIVDSLASTPADEQKGPWRLMFVDDIKTYHTAESFANLGTKNTDWFEAVNQLDND